MASSNLLSWNTSLCKDKSTPVKHENRKQMVFYTTLHKKRHGLKGEVLKMFITSHSGRLEWVNIWTKGRKKEQFETFSMRLLNDFK